MMEQRRLGLNPIELRSACIITACQIVASSKSESAGTHDSVAKEVAILAIEILLAFDQEWERRTHMP
jgi:hypothetical protein